MEKKLVGDLVEVKRREKTKYLFDFADSLAADMIEI
jgi:hypothetical protein